MYNIEIKTRDKKWTNTTKNCQRFRQKSMPSKEDQKHQTNGLNITSKK